ncbi:DsbA family protein [Halocynthiibacter sp. C4]|uniref:DsbA family protein n=1 Tax=Halocynthiibacter sp. C4 TaxID=2992758 RepID=UPI00237C1775|nr:DsbA family protein [Halocynthiibacter sp. C4]MDE0591059.1 DsbA family protein [Halocynthiibacter sp. C4]
MKRREFTAALTLSLIPAFTGGIAFAQDESGIKDMTLGADDAPITVIEYASYTCPHCANFHKAVFDKLKENYIDTGKVKFIYREVYFDRYGLWASMIARCGGDMRFFGISDMLYDTQSEWAKGEPADIAENLRKIGLKAGIEQDALDACMADGETAQKLVEWYQKNATADDITGTPSFIINGEPFGNANYEDFSKHLDSLL